MESIRNKIQELDHLADYEDIEDLKSFVDEIKNESLSILDDIESVVNDAEYAISNINKSEYIDLDNIEEKLHKASISLF